MRNRTADGVYQNDRQGIKEAEKYYSGDTKIIIQALNRTSLGLIKHLFTKSERVSYCFRK